MAQENEPGLLEKKWQKVFDENRYLFVDFNLTVDDHDALTKSVEKKNKTGKFLRWGATLVTSLFALMTLLDQWNINSIEKYAYPAFWILLGNCYRFDPILARWRFCKSPLSRNKFKILIAEPGVMVMDKDQDDTGGMEEWRSITKVEETPTHIFLFLSPKKALIVPKRAFASPTSATAFGAYAYKCWQEAHSVPVTAPIAAP